MYEETTEAACFDPNNMAEEPPPAPAATTIISTTTTTAGSSDIIINPLPDNNNGFSHHLDSTTSTNNIDDHFHPNSPQQQQQQQLDPSMEIDHHTHIHHQQHHLQNLQNFSPLTNCTPLEEPTNNWAHDQMGFTHFEETPTSTTDLLTQLLHLPRCSLPPAPPSLAFGKAASPTGPLGFFSDLNPAMMPENPTGSGSSTISYDPPLSYDPLFPLNLPPQPSPLLRDLMFQSLPHGGGTAFGGIQTRGSTGNVNVNVNGSSSNSLFGGLDEGDQGNIINGVSGIYSDVDHHHHHHNHNHNHNLHMHHHSNGIFEFTRGNACLGDGKEGKCPKNFVTERQRRQNFNDKYKELKELIPSPTKNDRASIVGDAIKYIEELKRTVGELKLLVEKKRISKARIKRLKNEDASGNNAGGGDHQVQGVEGAGVVKPEPDEAFNGLAATQLRSSWLQRKCKDTEVDVRIVDDEVTIKLVQRKKINCLLSVSRSLDVLQLDLRHVAGGHVGDYYSYLFNTKICEGSSVYASAIANKMIEVVERQYATAASVGIAPTSSF